MARVSTDEVKEIMIDLDSAVTDAKITACITAANITVTNTCTSTSLSAAQLKEIERWFSAHLVCIMDPQLVSEEAMDAKDTYQQKIGLGLNQTRYGQQAMVLDTSGSLGKLGEKKITASLTVLNPTS